MLVQNLLANKPNTQTHLTLFLLLFTRHATGKALGDYEDFLTSFVTVDGKVWGQSHRRSRWQ